MDAKQQALEYRPCVELKTEDLGSHVYKNQQLIQTHTACVAFFISCAQKLKE